MNTLFRLLTLGTWSITLAAALLLGLGVMRFDSGQPQLQWLDAHARGWVYRVVPDDPDHDVRRIVEDLARWLDAPAPGTLATDDAVNVEPTPQ